MVGDLARSVSIDLILQLRDSAGLSPASPLRPGIRAEGHHDRTEYSDVYVLSLRAQYIIEARLWQQPVEDQRRGM
jgi:hypothetical protein